MKRLVDDKKQELLDNLLESVSVDNKGNMEIGKNLGVDGTITINSAKDLKTKTGDGFVTTNGNEVIGGKKAYLLPGNYWNEKLFFLKDYLSLKQFSSIGTEGDELFRFLHVGEYALRNTAGKIKTLERNMSHSFYPTNFGMFLGTANKYVQNDQFVILAGGDTYSSNKRKGMNNGVVIDGGKICIGTDKEGLPILGTMTYDEKNSKVLMCGILFDNLPIPKNDSEEFFVRLQPNKSGFIALTSDLEGKQSTLYRHTVLISEPTNKTAYLAFTAESEKNTPIDSIQDLITVFGNTSIACSGLYRDGDPSNEQSLLMINVGTSISNTTIASVTLENSSITSFSNASFADTFGTTEFTITDTVTAM